MDEAFAAYEAVRHRLPQVAPAPKSYRQVDTLSDIAEGFDVFLLDAFGVLNIGDRAIPGTAERVEALRAAGKQVLVVSNAASVPRVELQAKYRRLGHEFPLDDIVTSRATMAASMAQLLNIHWGVMLGDDTRLDDIGRLSTVQLGDAPESYAEAEGFLLIGSGTWTQKRQSLLEAALRDKPRRVLVANPDIVAPRESGFSAEPGHFAHQLANHTGVAPEFFGKPFVNIYDQAFSRTGATDKSRMLMVGDSLHTDILGAQAAGISSALIASYGFMQGRDVNAAIDSSGICPDFVVQRP